MSSIDVPLTRAAYNAAVRASFAFFLQRCYETLGESEPLEWNWHIDAMCHALDRVRRGEDRRLCIGIGPRHLKSMTVSVAFPAWCLGHDPSLKFICASYGSELSLRLSRQFKQIVSADWYKMAFPQLRLSRITEGDIWTSKGGFRTTTSVGGSVTGNGADYIIVDDLSKAQDAHSPAALEAAREFYRGSLTTRLNNPQTGKIIVIAQRLHEDDVPGYCLETGIFRHLNLPSVAQRDEIIPLGGGRTHAWRTGELLFAARFPRHILDEKEKELGHQSYSAQYLQDPTPMESDFIRWSDIPSYEVAPHRREFTSVVQSWDTAEAESAHADYSACSTWGFFRGKWLLLDMLRFRAGFRDLVAQARLHREKWRPDIVLIEEAGSGRHLLGEFRHELRTAPQKTLYGWQIRKCRPTASKIERWAAQAAKLEAGEALLPVGAPWLETLRYEVTGFPRRRHDDQVDSVSQFLEWITAARTAVTLAREFNRGPDWPRRPRYVDPDDEEEQEDDVSYWLKHLRRPLQPRSTSSAAAALSALRSRDVEVAV
jgi:predicted phage terminase large subunit-like protein